MLPSLKVALVTGGNRGIGLEIGRQLAHLENMTVILGCRDPEKGEQARSQLGLPNAVVQQLDVSDESSRMSAYQNIHSQYGRLDILVNNAGIFPDRMGSALDSNVELLRAAMETNLYGPFRLCQLFIPMMKQHNYGRIVNLSSGMGQLTDMNGGSPAYRTSKTALNALTRLLADELRGTQVLINSMCPGWVRTEMGGPEATRDVIEGADTAVWLATLPANGPSGEFFRDRRVIPW